MELLHIGGIVNSSSKMEIRCEMAFMNSRDTVPIIKVQRYTDQ